MIFDPDHMSVDARQESLDVHRELEYSGVVSSHSWSTPDAYPRIYKAGWRHHAVRGHSAGFVDKWEQHRDLGRPALLLRHRLRRRHQRPRRARRPRGAGPEPGHLPVHGLGGAVIDRQVSGQRVYDINVDGVAHYGLYPDWIEDLRQLAGDQIVEDMARGSEAYLQMWERAEGITNDACRDPAAKSKAAVIGTAKGTTVQNVLLKAGLPHARLGTYFTYCAKTASGAEKTVTVTFDAAGKVESVA